MSIFSLKLRSWLAHPLMRGQDLDDPRTTKLRREIVRGKPFLRSVYQDWYKLLARSIPAGPGHILELGSGAGFLNEIIPEAITSEVFSCPGTKVVMDGQRMSLDDGCLRAVVMTDVFHHLPLPREFLREAARTVCSGGVISMIEPWVSPWSRIIYTRLHHEPFRPDSATWEFPPAGPLSGANGAMPWIIFHRDRTQFEREFSQWRIKRIRPFMPLRYLLSGGVSMRALAPGWSTPICRGIETALAPCRNATAMFAHIVLERI